MAATPYISASEHRQKPLPSLSGGVEAFTVSNGGTMILPLPPLLLLFQLPVIFLMVINKEARREAMVAFMLVSQIYPDLLKKRKKEKSRVEGDGAEFLWFGILPNSKQTQNYHGGFVGSNWQGSSPS
uniref:Uncharacterized protein n=1 Tax=Lotus japonicus TaxID=34305 RepID=I3S527_LOTJA|nr:unknown [Lotus japonicus]